jgi:hypothetical protein
MTEGVGGLEAHVLYALGAVIDGMRTLLLAAQDW